MDTIGSLCEFIVVEDYSVQRATTLFVSDSANLRISNALSHCSFASYKLLVRVL